MIASLSGTIVSAVPPVLVLDCNGVGYEVWMPASSFASMPAAGETLHVHTSLVVRDDSHSLYGFLEAHEKELFLNLIRISGIGAKGALALLSGLDAAALARAVDTRDAKILMRAPGIGRKTAERIIVELRDKKVLHQVPAETPVLAQAIEGLISLGYPAGQARAALAGVEVAGADAATLIKQALANLSNPA